MVILLHLRTTDSDGGDNGRLHTCQRTKAQFSRFARRTPQRILTHFIGAFIRRGMRMSTRQYGTPSQL